MKIGVFDSGVGGKSVVNAIQKAMPELEVIYAQDRDNVPYGTKSPAELKRLVIPILEKLVVDGCQVIVIACNTVTTTLISDLRQQLPVPLVGIEPMVKPAAEQSKSKIIAVCATPTTLASPRYSELKRLYAQGVQVLEPDCSDWAYLIENNQHNSEIISQRIVEVCEQGADVIVLGCTHYHWIEQEIKEIAARYNASVIQPEQPVIEQLKRVLARLA